jgi:anti-sigma B factor antagonist
MCGAAAVNFSGFRSSQEVANEYDNKPRQVGGIMILEIGGRIEIGEESASVRAAIRNLLNKGYKQILFNLGHVDCIDNIGLGPLVGAFTTVRKQGGELKLLNLPEKFADVKQITKLYTVFDIINDEAVAVTSFSQSTAKARA